MLFYFLDTTIISIHLSLFFKHILHLFEKREKRCLVTENYRLANRLRKVETNKFWMLEFIAHALKNKDVQHA